MTEHELALIRDEIGSTPDDDTLEEWHAELGHWLPVAIRALKRRRADAAAGGAQATSLSLSGVLSVGLAKTDVTALDAQIARMEAQWAALNRGTTGGLIRRPDRYR
jgi:hypothetical protein